MVSERGVCIYSCPYLPSLRISEEKNKQKIVPFRKAIQRISFSTILADMKIFSHSHTHSLFRWCLLDKKVIFCRKANYLFLLKIHQKILSHIPKKLEIHLEVNLGLKFSCFHCFSWVLQEAPSWKCLQCQALELSSIRASLSTAKQGYTKK